MLTETNR